MVSSEKKLANAMRGKTARACDCCIRKRARWYCAADDAFLCQNCDALVHSANPLARGHERVSLKVASVKLFSLEIPAPKWHQGFTKKSRTPRTKHNNKHGYHRTPKSKERRTSFNPLHIVPEIGSDEVNSGEQLPYQVPVFDPFSSELSFSGEFNDVEAVPIKLSDAKLDESEVPFHLNSLNGLILPSDSELAEFAGDVQSLLGNSFDEESFDIEALGMVDCRFNDSERVKVEDEEQREAAECEIEMIREPFQLSLDYDSPVAWEVEDEKVTIEDSKNQLGVIKNEDENFEVVGDDHDNIIHGTSMKNTKMLKLDYERIIAAWDDHRSPWTTGDRPEMDPNDCWPNCMAGCGNMHHHHCGDMGNLITMLDGGREARVSRYREKRRTRLFSKKIRYEVRKVNAEKRPRIKGRFVKRTSIATTISGFPLHSK